jgi:hypothetical protein
MVQNVACCWPDCRMMFVKSSNFIQFLSCSGVSALSISFLFCDFQFSNCGFEGSKEELLGVIGVCHNLTEC